MFHLIIKMKIRNSAKIYFLMIGKLIRGFFFVGVDLQIFIFQNANENKLFFLVSFYSFSSHLRPLKNCLIKCLKVISID